MKRISLTVVLKVDGREIKGGSVGDESDLSQMFYSLQEFCKEKLNEKE